MYINKSDIYQPSLYQLRYIVFFIFLLLGPSLALFELRAVHLTFCFLLLTGCLYILKHRLLDKKVFLLLATYFLFLFLWIVNHAVLGGFSLRYIAYCYYFTFTFFIFYFSFRTLITVPRIIIRNVIQVFICINILIAIAEIFIGISFFAFNPLAGTEYQIGSSFWANVNTNAVALILLNTSLYFLGYKKHFYINAIPILIFCFLVDAKLCILALVGQLVVAQLIANATARVFFAVAIVIITPVILFVFQKQLNVVFLTLIQAFSFFENSDLLAKIVSSGDVSSVVIRAFALSEMLNQIYDFSLTNLLFGIGFGNLNISFVNNKWGGLVEYFSPHLFYLEIIIYLGISYYVFYFMVMKIVAGRLPWRSILIATPTLGSVVAISSAVYFLPLYFFLAVLSFWEYEQLNNEVCDVQ